MPLLSFQEQFVQAVENGLDLRAGRPLRHPGVRPKTQSIRAYWKNGHNPHRAGVTEKMWTKVRTPERRKLGEAVCTGAYWINISKSREMTVDEAFDPDDEMTVNSIAAADGFDWYEDMYDFFEKTHGLPFKGVLIRW